MRQLRGRLRQRQVDSDKSTGRIDDVENIIFKPPSHSSFTMNENLAHVLGICLDRLGSVFNSRWRMPCNADCPIP